MSNFLRITCALLILWFSVAPVAFAVSDPLIISQTIIGTDTDAPTIPGGVSATAVSTSQINITWNNSTDNVGVDGYQLFRGGIQIATTTLTSYSDIGLASETTYAYTVRAFDGVLNISTSSATSTATTDAVIATSTPESGDGGGGGHPLVIPRISNLAVVAEEYAADMTWETSIPTRSIVSWGTTRDYEIASLEERSLLEVHGTRLTGLTPGTQYYFRILARDRYDRETVLVESSFVTKLLPDEEAPSNASGLRGVAEGDDVLLSWGNPPEADFDRVRVVRRMDGFPVDPFDGVVVYEGAGEAFTDKDAFAASEVTQYAVFAYDTVDNVSSGAIVRVRKQGSIEPPPPPPPSGTPVLQFKDLVFRQEGREISYIGNDITINGAKSLEISIPYERLPEHLKTIMVTLTSPADSALTFSFLLRVNANRSAYTAVLAPLGPVGEFPLSLSVLDYNQRTVTEVVGKLIVAEETPESIVEGGWFGNMKETVSRIHYLIWILVLLLILAALWAMAFNAGRKKIKETGPAHS